MGRRTLINAFRDQYTRVPPVVQADLKGKTVVIVGANTGLGFEAAQHFARMGAGKLILACRSLRDATGHTGIELWLVDLAEFSSVKAFADKVLGELGGLDILMLNAGVGPGMGGKYEATVDGWENTLQVNALSGSLLALLLLPHMFETAQRFNTTPRIVVVSSEVHYWASIEDKVFESPNAFELMGSKEYCTPQQVPYGLLQMLNIFFTRALNNRLRSKDVIVNTINPGFCYSELHRNMRGLFVTVFEKLLARTAEEGGRLLVWAAVGTPDGDANSVDELRGAYINLAKVEEPAEFVHGESGKKKEEKLWTDLISTLEGVDPRIKEVVRYYLS
ncbi:WW domain-containing oxidoreductase [Leucoagaricus sp. SymC.cos]|nr:WW domain-containing oxidoreductase [Leucoagaricus sp. SymC.cos]